MLSGSVWVEKSKHLTVYQYMDEHYMPESGYDGIISWNKIMHALTHHGGSVGSHNRVALSHGSPRMTLLTQEASE